MRPFLVGTAIFIAAGCVAASQPAVSIEYSPALDAACSMVRGPAIKEEWKTELVSRKSEFDDLWRSIGTKLMREAEAITGRPFSTQPVEARLTLCNIPSQSIAGVIVNMRFALRSFTPNPVSIRYKVDTLFHELLHVYLSSYPLAESRLLFEHASEPECVRNHLHLLALQKAVLLNLQEVAALHEVVAVDGQLPNGCYKRAWVLVNATDGEYLKYVAELKK